MAQYWILWQHNKSYYNWVLEKNENLYRFLKFNRYRYTVVGNVFTRLYSESLNFETGHQKYFYMRQEEIILFTAANGGFSITC